MTQKKYDICDCCGLTLERLTQAKPEGWGIVSITAPNVRLFDFCPLCLTDKIAELTAPKVE